MESIRFTVFGDIAIFRFRCLALELPFTLLFLLRMCRIKGKFTSEVETIHIFGFIGS